MSAHRRRIWLCADDYGMTDGVNRSIRELIAARRLNATSVMVVGSAISANDVALLDEAVALNPSARVGLHVTLTAPFTALTMHYRPLTDGLFPPLGNMLARSMLRLPDAEIIEAEVASQIAAFTKLFGRPPAYVDGHQHVHIFPKVRDGFLRAVKQHAGNAWVRQCGRTSRSNGGSPKVALLNYLSNGFRKRADQHGITCNPDFDGAYDFAKVTDFGQLLRGFLTDLTEGGLVMCHPGYVDELLVSLDPFTHQREVEHAYLASDAFPALLAELNLTLD